MTGTAPDVALPRRPRLLPGLEVLDRRADELQIGLDPRHAVVATGLPPVLVDILRGLDGSRNTSTLLTLATEEHAARLRTVLTDLARQGLVEEAEPDGTGGGADEAKGLWSVGFGRNAERDVAVNSQGTIRVHGSGRLAAAVTAALAASGFGHIDVRAEGVVSSADLGSGFVEQDVDEARSEALRNVVRRVAPGVRTQHLPYGRTPDLVLLTDAVVPAPDVVAGLVATGVPHLVVRVRDGIGIVGPLVSPGRSSCLRCADLHRTGFDPCWPTVAGQLAGRCQRADLTSVHGTAAVAAGQTLRALAVGSEPPPTWNATLELDCYTGHVRRREWPPHPHCECGAGRRSRHG